MSSSHSAAHDLTFHPTYKLYKPKNWDVAKPFTTSAPTGFSPATLRAAYGASNINFAGGLVGDGSGQTVAIIDAYDNPRFVSSTDPNFVNSDLHKFDVANGLADPPSYNKVNQAGQQSN
jgi:subtilase family serine protease